MTQEPERQHGELGGPRRPGPEQPKWKLLFWRADWVWRRVVPLIALGLAGYAVWGLSGKVDANQDALTRQVEGRRVALEVLCGGISGVEDAGRKILTNTLPPPAPSPSATPTGPEKLTREDYAEAYALVISRRVIQEAGASARGILRDDGTIDCAALKRESQAVQRGQKTLTP